MTGGTGSFFGNMASVNKDQFGGDGTFSW